MMRRVVRQETVKQEENVSVSWHARYKTFVRQKLTFDCGHGFVDKQKKLRATTRPKFYECPECAKPLPTTPGRAVERLHTIYVRLCDKRLADLAMEDIARVWPRVSAYVGLSLLRDYDLFHRAFELYRITESSSRGADSKRADILNQVDKLNKEFVSLTEEMYLLRLTMVLPSIEEVAAEKSKSKPKTKKPAKAEASRR